jgi:hypothetical protein
VEGPRGKLESIKLWREGDVCYAGDVVTHKGSTYWAARDTGRPPGDHADWRVLATAGSDGRDGAHGRDGVDGRSFNIRDTYDPAENYKHLDVVTLNASWFVARTDDPGPCPGPGWKAGPSGKTGKPGDRGPAGAKGDKGDAGREVVAWEIDRRKFCAVPILNDGEHGPEIELRDLFEQFQIEAGGD